MWWLWWLLAVGIFLVVCFGLALAMGMCRVADREDRRMGAKE